MSPSRTAWLWPIAVVFIALIVYRLTLMPGPGLSDTAEFQSVPHVLGIAHPTGYATYTLLGKLASYWPEGSIAWRMNWFAALCAAGAAGGLVALARSLGAGWGPAVAAGLALAFQAAFWQNALSAEPHMLHMAFVIALLALGVAWRRGGEARVLAGAALLAGLGLGNHLQLVMLLPAWVALFVLTGPTWKRFALGLGSGLAGLSVFLYLPLRALQHPPINYAHPDTFERFKYLVLGEQFKGDMAFLSLEGVGRFLVKLGRLPLELGAWWSPASLWLIGGLAVVGAVAQARRDWRLGVFLGLAWLVPLYAACNYANEDLRRYFFTSCAVTLLVAAIGAQALLAPLAKTRAPWIAGLLAGALALAPLGLIPYHWAHVDASRDTTGREVIDTVLDTVKPNAVVISWWNVSTALWYGRFVEARRPDVAVIDDRNLLDDGWGTVDRAVEAHFGQRPVYVIRFEGDTDRLKQRYRLVPVATLPPQGQPVYEVLPRE